MPKETGPLTIVLNSKLLLNGREKRYKGGTSVVWGQILILREHQHGFRISVEFADVDDGLVIL